MFAETLKKLDFTIGAKKYQPVSFISHSGTQAISCSYKAAAGFLYPLERGFIFVHKPPLHIRFEEVAYVNFARSQGPGKAFDFEVEVKTV